jgi:hypothetical protein
MKIIRIPLVYKEKQKHVNIHEFLRNRVENVLYGLNGTAKKSLPYSEPGGNVSPDMRERPTWVSGIDNQSDNALELIPEWIQKFSEILAEKDERGKPRLRTSSLKKGCVVHYIIRFNEGDVITDAAANQALSLFLEEMGYGDGDDFMLMGVMHNGPNEYHLHLIIFRYNLRLKKIYRECNGWWILAVRRAQARITAELNLEINPGDWFQYINGEFLSRDAAMFERSTGNESEERIVNRAAKSVGNELASGGITSWQALKERCALHGIEYFRNEKGSVFFKRSNGISVTGIPAIRCHDVFSKKNLEDKLNCEINTVPEKNLDSPDVQSGAMWTSITPP